MIVMQVTVCVQSIYSEARQQREWVRCKQRKKHTEDQEAKKEMEKMHQGHKINSGWGKFGARTLTEKYETLCKRGNTRGDSTV